ncbi:MAG: hypothetical protein ACNA8K_09575 [Cyclonatronaceae bacterium]
MKSYGQEGYIYHVYGQSKYLRHAVASALTIKRYDTNRKIALVCEEKHKIELAAAGLSDLFDVLYTIAPDHRSITGFKHNVHYYQLFDRSLFLDSDMIWCRDSGKLWSLLSAYKFTITGNLKADAFFGAAKGPRIIFDLLMKKRERTLKRFGLTYLSRVQSGMIFVQDNDLAQKICELADNMISRKDETHFQSRNQEHGRTLESCEWSLAMAMSVLDVPVFPWLQGHTSPQLDYIEDQCIHDENFEDVYCKYFTNSFIYSLRGIRHNRIRNLMIDILSFFPGYGDYMMVKPFCIHFGWLHQKQPFYEFSDRIWADHAVSSGSDNM